MKITLPDASEVARVLSDDHVPALRGGGDHHAARPSPHVQMIVRLEWLFLLLVALSLMVRPVPVALAEVPDGITTNDEHQPYQFDVNAARLGRRRVQGHRDRKSTRLNSSH